MKGHTNSVKLIAAGSIALVLLCSSNTSARVTAGRTQPHGLRAVQGPDFVRPWTEGIDPTLENQVFDATYHVLNNHNILKVYVFDAARYQAAGIRFSARVPHEHRDLTLDEMDREAATLIRTTFDQFPSLRSLDVWATIPVALARQTTVENTVFSVSAQRATYEAVRGQELSDAAFLGAFGQLWAAPEIPR